MQNKKTKGKGASKKWTKRQRESYESCKEGVLDYAKTHNIKVEFDSPHCKSRDIGFTDGRTVWLGEMSNSAALILVFSHEAGHVMLIRDRKAKKWRIQPSIYEQEFIAWKNAMEIMREHFGYKMDQEVALYIRRCLETYRKYEGNF